MKMRIKPIVLLFTAMVLISIVSTVCSASITADPIGGARRITACILQMAGTLAPVVSFAMFIMGGYTYLTAADDNKQRILGKKFMIMAIVGIICVRALIFIAAQPPFNIPLSLCVMTSSGVPPVSGASSGASSLTSPPQQSTIS